MFNRRDLNTTKPVKLQHRHFALIADIIRNLPHNVPVSLNYYRTSVAEHFANKLARTNPGFDRDRFIAACTEKD